MIYSGVDLFLSSFSLVHLFGFASIFPYTYLQSTVYETSPTAPTTVDVLEIAAISFSIEYV